VNERDEMQEEEGRKIADRAEALSEAMRILPMAQSWCVVAVMPDGNPALMVSCPRYADAVCILHTGAEAMRKHLAGFHSIPSQGI
jgi:hypothetical protein